MGHLFGSNPALELSDANRSVPMDVLDIRHMFGLMCGEPEIEKRRKEMGGVLDFNRLRGAIQDMEPFEDALLDFTFDGNHIVKGMPMDYQGEVLYGTEIPHGRGLTAST